MHTVIFLCAFSGKMHFNFRYSCLISDAPLFLSSCLLRCNNSGCNCTLYGCIGTCTFCMFRILYVSNQEAQCELILKCRFECAKFVEKLCKCHTINSSFDNSFFSITCSTDTQANTRVMMSMKNAQSNTLR